MALSVIPIESVLPGSVLGDHVHDASGRVLLRVGTLLTEAVIESLQRRDIKALTIDVKEVVDPARLQAYRAEAERRLVESFRKAGHGEASRALRQATLEFMLEHRP